MKDALQARMEGFRKSIREFSAKMGCHEMTHNGIDAFKDLLTMEMGELGFDVVEEDSLGTIYGILKGIEPGKDILLITHLEEENTGKKAAGNFKAGIASALYAAGAIKSALLPLKGDLIVCCVPRLLFGSYAIEHFYEEILKSRTSKIKGIMLSEPTDGKINLGHKGRIEYEIIIRGHMAGHALQARGLNMLGSLFPLVNELEKVSAGLPQDRTLGRSSLRIKDIQYNNPDSASDPQEFRLAVDRVFVPEETPTAILERARRIASDVYSGCGDLAVSADLVRSKVKGASGEEGSLSELKPWVMPGHHPFVISSMEALNEAGFKTDHGFWKNTFTEGSFTCGTLGLPTLGFGPGSEENGDSGSKVREIERAALGQALIIHRNIGIPSFGWCADEI